jgi:microcystin degradation protein MlrC
MRGERVLATRGQAFDVGGAVDACERLGVEPVPLLCVNAQPAGTIERSSYEGFKQEILEGVKRERPDGVYLALHGAGVVDGLSDLEGDLVAALREVVGKDVPVAASFDLHGNVTQQMVDLLDGVFVCHHYPHIDLHERAGEAVALIVRMHKDGLRPERHLVSLPLLLPTTTTFEGVGEQMLKTMLAAEDEPGVLDVSWFHGFPYTDVPHIGSYIVVSTEGDAGQAKRVAEELAQTLWKAREDFRARSLSAPEAVGEALTLVAPPESEKRAPVVINETSDNCGGGAPGDGTHLLRAMLDARLEKACFGFIVDAEVAAQAHAAGVGRDIEISLGGKTDDLHGEPLDLRAHVKALHDGRLTMQHMFKGAPLNLGPLARLVVDGIDIVVGSRRSQTFDREPFLAVGIDVMKYDIVALKSSNHFRAGFQHLARAIVTADPPGLTTHHIEVFSRQQTAKALWPVNDQATFTM